MNALTGTGALIRLALRRDRIRMPVWILVFAVSTIGAAAATAGLYPTAASRIEFSTSANAVPALVALYGPIYDPASLGAVSMLKLTAFGAALVALLTILTVVRHTRAEEEAGRHELLGAAEVGRSAPLAAGLVAAALNSFLIGAVTAVGLILIGLPVGGSLTEGLGWTFAGFTFGALAAVTAQLSKTSRVASSLAITALGAAYFLRAVGDSAGPEWLSWLSPIGWVQQVRPFAGDRWALLLIPLAVTAALTVLAVRLAHRRDAGAGLIAERTGHAHAGRGLRGAWGLVWRLNRGGLLTWTSVFLLLGLVCGNIASSVGDFLGNDRAKEFIAALGGEKGIADSFLAAEFGAMGVIASVYAILVVIHLHTEERGLKVELLLATGLSRTRLMGVYLAFALAASVLLAAVVGASAGVMYGLQIGDVGGQVPRLLGAALAPLPAVWAMAGLAAALFGFLPRWLAVAWAALVGFLLLGEFGVLLRAPQWVLNLSPFTHLPKLPDVTVTFSPLVWLTALAVLLTAAGVAGFRRRDINAV
ncbi:ABC transporter permease [Amycolatopsis sp. NPDC059657]|uniref:ABC transporter permease n=1 Tax=Amycolatopsis sp. NPDC059657 TaxID=3346899 RepID=UPI00366CDE89